MVNGLPRRRSSKMNSEPRLEVVCHVKLLMCNPVHIQEYNGRNGFKESKKATSRDKHSKNRLHRSWRSCKSSRRSFLSKKPRPDNSAPCTRSFIEKRVLSNYKWWLVCCDRWASCSRLGGSSVFLLYNVRRAGALVC